MWGGFMFAAKHLAVILALAATVILVGCGGGASAAPSGPASSVAPGEPSPTPPAADSSRNPANASAQFGGDICSALTKAEIEGASYTQGKAVFSSTDTQTDADTGVPVVCQYLVTFGGSVAVVAHSVSVMDATEFGTHEEASIMEPAESVSGIGKEAYLVANAPGLYEVWVNGPHGYFKVSGQSKESDIALAKAAVGRN
jgi:hypothetical protein